MLDTKLLLDQMSIAGYTKQAVAQHIGVSKNTFTKIVKNERQLTSDEIVNICNLLKITDNDCIIRIFLKGQEK